MPTLDESFFSTVPAPLSPYFGPCFAYMQNKTSTVPDFTDSFSTCLVRALMQLEKRYKNPRVQIREPERKYCSSPFPIQWFLELNLGCPAQDSLNLH